MLIQGPTLAKIVQTFAFDLNTYKQTYKHISTYHESVARMHLLQDVSKTRARVRQNES